jgi:hydrogenase nickel incorporation protein HypA/HybF
MHELTMAESVISMVESAARQAQAQRVIRVRLALGMLAHVEPDTLLYCCELVGRDGVAAGAIFEIERTPAAAWCNVCLKTVALGAIGAPCPECGGYQLNITAGDEMRVVEIAVA